MKSYSLITPPAIEPVSVQEAAEFLRAGCAEDELALIAAIIATAREVVENFTGRALATSEWLVAFESWGDGLIKLERSPLASVQSVKYWPADDGAQVTLSGSDYLVITATTPGQIKITADLPALADRPDAVQVAFTAGATAAARIPATLRHAVRLLIAHLYELRQPLAVGNIVNELPYSLRHLLESQRIGGWSA